MRNRHVMLYDLHYLGIYRDGKKGWYVVARNFFLLLLNNSRQDQAAVA